MSKDADAIISSGYERYADQINRRLRTYLPISEDREDVVQDTFLKAYSNFDRFNGLNLQAWLNRIAINTAIDYLRRRTSRPTVPFDVPIIDDLHVSQASLIPSPDLLPEEVLLQRDESAQVRDAIDQLPPKPRLVTLYHYIGGLSIEETADRLDMSQSATKSSFFRAKQELRPLLQPLYNNEEQSKTV